MLYIIHIINVIYFITVLYVFSTQADSEKCTRIPMYLYINVPVQMAINS